MKVTNQKPIVLNPVHKDQIANAFNPHELLRTTVVTPLYNPLVANTAVTITGNGHNITDIDITNHIINCCGDTVNLPSEAFMKELFHETLINFNKNTNIGINEAFVVQSGTAAKLPEPNDKVIYTPAQDVIPVSRQFLGGQCDYDTFFASLAYYARPHTLGFYFANNVAFDDFKTWLTTQMQMLSNVLPPETIRLMSDFQTLSLTDLTESLQLRNDDNENNDPYSFARTLVSQLMLYTNVVSNAEFGVLPFTIDELLCPKTVVLVNVERHSKATSREINEEWKLINQCLQNKPTMISNKKLNRLTATQRNLQKIASAAAAAAANSTANIGKAANMKFSKTRPTTTDMMKLIKRIMDKMTFVNKSMNTYKQVKTSFARPNRRNPDDFNKPGKMVSTKYKPDIHLYIDTSGSISERDYEDAVKACITMSKKMNINLYFNSFSHYMSQTTKLHLENKSKSQIYHEFRRIPKVTGGTDYEQIWHFINSSKKRTREISIIITDFEYSAPNKFIKHPKNLYYIPCSTIDYNNIKYWAEQFAKTCLHNDPNIRKHILF